LRHHAPNGLIQRWNELCAHLKNHVQGLGAYDPTTPSVTAAEPGGVATLRCNLTSGLVLVDGVPLVIPTTADYAVSGGTKLCAVAQSVIISLVAKNNGGTMSLEKVVGTAAATGAQVPPDDAAVQAALGGAGIKWVRVADVTYNHTGDGTSTQSEDNTSRPVFGGNVSATLKELLT
jgi:hypothetical protein